MGATKPEQCVLKFNEMTRVKCFASGDALLGDTCIPLLHTCIPLLHTSIPYPWYSELLFVLSFPRALNTR